MLRVIHLHGEAGRLYGEKFVLSVENLGEAVRAISVQVPGFQQYVESRDFQCVKRSKDGDMDLGEEDVYLGLGRSELHIIPVLHGAGGKGIGKIIAGTVLAAFSFFVAPAIGITSIMGVSMTTVGMLGIGLALSGVSSLLSSQKKTKKGSDDNKSSLFGSAPQVATQGAPVPLVFGTIRVGDMPVISAQIITARV